MTQQLVTQIADQSVILADIHDEQIAFRRSLMRVHDKLEDLRPEDLG